MLAYEHYKCHGRNPADPGITQELRIERKQALRILRISACGRFPVDDARLAVELADGVEIGNKFMPPGKGADHFDLQVFLWSSNANAIFLRESFEQVDPLVDQTVPGLTLFALQGGLSEGAPFFKEGRRRILPTKQSGESFFEATTKNHRGPRVLFPPSIEIVVPVAARAAEVFTDLGVTQDHASISFVGMTLAVVHESVSHSPAGAKASRFWQVRPLMTEWEIRTTPCRFNSALTSTWSWLNSSAS